MAIFLNKDSKIIVQGMTGATGMKHTKLMLADGSNIVGGVNPRKAGTSVDIDGTEIPVFGTVAEAIEKTGANVSVLFVPPAFAKAAVVEAIDAEIPSRSSSPRASRSMTPPPSGRTRSRRATRPASSARTAPVSSPRASRTPASSRATSRSRAVSVWSRSPAR